MLYHGHEHVLQRNDSYNDKKEDNMLGREYCLDFRYIQNVKKQMSAASCCKLLGNSFLNMECAVPMLTFSKR